MGNRFGREAEFYVNKMKPCLRCPKHKDESCPYFFTIKGKEHKQKFLYDEFGKNRCVPEFNYFINLRNTFLKEYQIPEADLPLLEKMCMIMVRAARVEEYLADEGLVQIRKMKDEKTGEIVDVAVQNLLKKDAYFDDKMLREWLENLKISRRSREITAESEDLAIIFTEQKSLQIKGTKGKTKEEVKELIQEAQTTLSSDKTER